MRNADGNTMENSAALMFVLGMLLVSSSAFARGGHGHLDSHCVPSFGEQRLVGMKCTEIKATSILHKAGVQDGDIVTSVDGKPTLSPRDMMGAVKTLRQADQAELKIIRGGKERELTYTK